MLKNHERRKDPCGDPGFEQSEAQLPGGAVSWLVANIVTNERATPRVGNPSFQLLTYLFVN